ncbi:TonB-dependent receptor, partial [Arthrospira platensis SPKY1]|nr:TonB-dependent receptor [Arthrospira platensis SPKY1]
INIDTEAIIPVADRYPNSTWTSYAAYINYQYLISDRWTFQSGARINSFDIRSDFSRHLEFYPFDFTQTEIRKGAPSGSMGLVYKPNPSTRISGNLGTGFRAPNVDDIGKIFDFAGQSVTVPNTNL